MSDTGQGSSRRSGELTALELARFVWRQLTSMRTALVLLLLLALAAVPGSVIPQESVDSFAARQWKEQHETLAPVYERLGLFDVYGSVWFAAVYVLLMVSLVGCILPRTRHYWRAARAVPPRAPRHLTRLPDHTTYVVQAPPAAVLEAAREVLGRRRYRLRPADPGDGDGAVAAERGYLREAGNLLFHLSVIVVLVGFAMGGLLGYKGGVIVLEGSGFSNNLTQYDDFVPGSFFTADEMEPFSFDVDSFDVEWLTEGPGQGMARAFEAGLTYRTSPDAPDRTYDLRVNHPLKIGDSEVFLVGHGYAPVITVRDGNGDIAWSAPTVFLPQDPSFFSFGVVKALGAEPQPMRTVPTVVGDAVMLHHLFDNLVGNAGKYVADGVAPHLVVEGRREGAHVVVDLTDNGIGVPPSMRRAVFERFSRVAGTGRKGTGLGLSICRTIAERHGGDISVTDGPGGRGSTFTVRLPAT